MKKLFTFVALLTCVLGAKAEGETIYEIDYSTKKGYPFDVMGFVPEWVDGVMTDLGGLYEYAKKDEAERTSDVIIETDSGVEYYRLDKLPGTGLWHQYLLADGIVTELNGVYTVKAMVKASEATTITVFMGWGLDQGQQVYKSATISTEWTEIEWEYSGIGSTSCNLVAQPQTAAQIEWKWLKISPYQKRSVTWQEWLTDDGKSIIPGVATESKYVGNAETPWPEWALEKTNGINANWRTDRAHEICAWSLTMGRNFDDQAQGISQDSPRARPYPSDIEEEEGNESNHVFAVHVTQIERIVGESEESFAWSNQFFIQAPRALKAGEQVRIKFRYKAQHTCFANTQWCKKNFVYLFWKAFGDISFTDKWQEFDKTIVVPENADGAWSIVFNLCSDETNGRTPNIFYFDDLSWQSMVLDEGYFVAASNTETGTNYEFDHAIAFKKDPFDESLIVATVGEVGKEETYVNSLMISTVRGNDDAFKSNTLKPSGYYFEDSWGDYCEASNAKITLPSASVWKISLDTESKQINILKIEGDDIPQKPKCATPEISYSNGKITFSCETEGATYYYSITNDDCKTGSEKTIQLCMTYRVYVYATKEGYSNSDVATREIVIENGQATLFGDLDKDGKVNVADHVKLSNIIMNK